MDSFDALFPRYRWFIVIQQRDDYNGRFPRNDFRAYRKFSVWPKTFPTERECREFMTACFRFEGLSGRKMSASTMDQFQLRRLTNPRVRF